MDNLFSKEDLIEKINAWSLDKNKFFEIILTGNKNFEINAREILKLIEHENVLKIKDCTSFKYNLEEIQKEKTLRGLFVKEMLKKEANENYTKKEIENAIEIGLNALMQ